MTELLCLTDAYVREFEAVVTAVLPEGVTLNRTAFYPGGGGQPNDVGWLVVAGTRWPVTKVRKVSGQVVHVLPAEAELGVGTAVAGQLDWERRYQLMRTHTPCTFSAGSSGVITARR